MVHRTAFPDFSAECSQSAMAFLLWCRISAASEIARQAAGLPTRRRRTPPSHIDGSPSTRFAIFSGMFQLAGSARANGPDRTSVGKGTRVSERVDLGDRRISKKKNKNK